MNGTINIRSYKGESPKGQLIIIYEEGIDCSKQKPTLDTDVGVLAEVTNFPE